MKNDKVKSDEIKKMKKDFVDEIRKDGIKFHLIRHDDNNQFGGAVVFAIRPTGKSEKFVDISVAVCHEDDQFKKIDGYHLAATRMQAGRYITIPRSGLNSDLVRHFFGFEL